MKKKMCLTLSTGKKNFINVKLENFKSKILLFCLSVDLQMQIYDVLVLVNSVIQNRGEPHHFQNSNEALACKIDISMNSIFKWDIYPLYFERLADMADLADKYVNNLFGFRLVNRGRVKTQENSNLGFFKKTKLVQKVFEVKDD